MLLRPVLERVPHLRSLFKVTCEVSHGCFWVAFKEVLHLQWTQASDIYPSRRSAASIKQEIHAISTEISAIQG